MQYFDPASAFNPDYGHGYNYWHIQEGADYEAVGEVQIYTGEELEFAGTGSGTLIKDPNDPTSVWVVTAAHVVDTATYLSVAFPEEETWEEIDGIYYRSQSYTVYGASEWYVPSSWSGFEEDGFFGNDVAMIRLTASPTTFSGITPMEMATTNPTLGTEIEIVGFGLTGDGHSGSTTYTGHRRAGKNTMDLMLGDSILLADFDAPKGAGYDALAGAVEDYPESLEYIGASGDSGGAHVAGGKLVGVHSFGWAVLDGDPDSSFLDLSGAISVAEWYDWIQDIMAGNAGDVTVGSLLDPILEGNEEEEEEGDEVAIGLHRQAVANSISRMLVEEYQRRLLAGDPTDEFLKWFDVTKLNTESETYDNFQGFLAGLGYGESKPVNIPEPISLALLLPLAGAAALRRSRA